MKSRYACFRVFLGSFYERNSLYMQDGDTCNPRMAVLDSCYRSFYTRMSVV